MLLTGLSFTLFSSLSLADHKCPQKHATYINITSGYSCSRSLNLNNIGADTPPPIYRHNVDTEHTYLNQPVSYWLNKIKAIGNTELPYDAAISPNKQSLIITTLILGNNNWHSINPDNIQPKAYIFKQGKLISQCLLSNKAEANYRGISYLLNWISNSHILFRIVKTDPGAGFSEIPNEFQTRSTDGSIYKTFTVAYAQYADGLLWSFSLPNHGFNDAELPGNTLTLYAINPLNLAYAPAIKTNFALTYKQANPKKDSVAQHYSANEIFLSSITALNDALRFNIGTPKFSTFNSPPTYLIVSKRDQQTLKAKLHITQ